MAFSLPYMYNLITKLCRQQPEDIQNQENKHARGVGQSEAKHRKYKRFTLGGGQAYCRD
jgi:hypothetical protein